MEYADFVQWVFYGVIGGSTVYGVSILQKMGKSIEQLNVNVAVLLERTNFHERQIEKHDDRISKLESK
jgi:hypothetical protein